MFYTLSSYTEHVLGKTEKTILDFTGYFAFVSCTLGDGGLQPVVYRPLGIHRWLPRAAEEVTKEQAVVLSLSKGLPLSCKFYSDLQVQKAQNHCFYTITITWKEMDGIFPISTSMDDSIPSSIIRNYFFRVDLLHSVHRKRAGRVMSNYSMICVLLVA